MSHSFHAKDWLPQKGSQIVFCAHLFGDCLRDRLMCGGESLFRTQITACRVRLPSASAASGAVLGTGTPCFISLHKHSGTFKIEGKTSKKTTTGLIAPPALLWWPENQPHEIAQPVPGTTQECPLHCLRSARPRAQASCRTHTRR